MNITAELLTHMRSVGSHRLLPRKKQDYPTYQSIALFYLPSTNPSRLFYLALIQAKKTLQCCGAELGHPLRYHLLDRWISGQRHDLTPSIDTVKTKEGTAKMHTD